MADWVKTVTTDLFFNRIGQAAIGTGTCARITSFKVGYGWVDESGATPVLTALTGAETSVPGSFMTGTEVDGDMILSYSGGVLLVQCVIEEGALTVATKASAIGVFDQDNNMIAASAFYPDWVTPDEEYRINLYINFPTSGA